MSRQLSSLSTETYAKLFTTNLIILLCIWIPLFIIIGIYPWLCDRQLIFFDAWIYLISIYWIMYQFFFRSNDQMLLIKTYFNAFIFLIPVFLIIQCLPMPANVVKLFSPKIWFDTQLMMNHAPWIFNSSCGWANLTYFPDQSLLLTIHSIACLMLFFLIVHTIKTRFQLNLFLNCLLGALVIGTVGGSLFCFDWKKNTIIPLVSHHMAIMMHLMIPLSLGLIMTYYRQTKKPVFKTAFYSIQTTLKNLIAGQQASLMKIALLMTIFFGGIFISNSFGLKLFSLSISVFIGGILLFNKKKMRSLIIVWCGLGLVLGLYALISNPTDSNISLNQVISSVAKDYPLTGLGFGALPIVVSKYSDIILNTQFLYENQYSGWLKLLAEIGLLGIGLWLFSVVVFTLRMYNMWLKRHSAFSSGWASGIMMAFIGLFFFGIGYGFGNIYIVLPTIAALAACGFLVLHAGHHTSRQPFFYRTVSIHRNNLRTRFAAIMFLVLLVTGITQLFFLRDAAPLSCKSFDELSSEKECIQLLKNNRFNACLWFETARWYRLQNKDPLNHINVLLPRADVCYEMSCYLSPKNDNIIFNTAKYWVFRSQMLDNKSKQALSDRQLRIPITKQQAILHFQNKFQTILKKHPERLSHVVDTIWEWYQIDSIVLGAISEKQPQLKQAALEYVLLNKTNH